MSINYQDALAMAEEWISAFNDRQLDVLMDHYAATIEFSSPRVAQVHQATQGEYGDASGTLIGVDALRRYFGLALKNVSNLRLELIQVLLSGTAPDGCSQIAVVYKRETGAVAAEVMALRPDRRVQRAVVFYGPGGM
ncbi:uncharacterized protein BJ171DRAFT_471430 [Polychytrium aggregatum]|uniref:uncharacterized protein n=1 Tax=Polychytrium aggregatum TaxID=110093 RepID=UPI0022FF359F|nr:uncharacterized protein BJ171DRAFT_471430 [Polychytrium aggregatum]KAI9209127.1 hypothetical protein BJ171DRAFT_471430 [Polychytrium aggregatum]